MIIAFDDKKQYICANRAIKSQKYCCPGCQEQVILKVGDVNQPHFAHYSGTVCATFTENETAQHLSGKLQLAEKFKKYGHVQIEAVLPEINQRPDILITLKERKVAVEYQCSPISQKRLDERNAGYSSQNIQVIWILGQNYFEKSMTQKSIIKFWAQKKLTFYLPDKERFVYRKDFWKCDFERIHYLEWMSHSLFEGTTKTQGINFKIEKQIYKLQNLLIQKRVDEKIVRYLYNKERLLLHAPLWMHKGHTFGLTIPNWHFRLLIMLLLERVGQENMVKKDDISNKLTKYLMGDDNFKHYQIALIFNDLEKNHYILQQGQHLLVRRLPNWHTSLSQKLCKMRDK